jgi:hypothetical protein
MPADELLHVLQGAMRLDAYSYAKDDQTSTFTCPPGTNYRVDFCPPTSGVMAGDDDGVRGHGLPRLSCRICASAAMVMVLLLPPATASHSGDRRELPNFRGFGVGLPFLPPPATVKTAIELSDCAAAVTVLLPPLFTASRGASWWRRTPRRTLSSHRQPASLACSGAHLPVRSREEEREERETKRSEDEEEEGRERVGSEADMWGPRGSYYF